MKLAKSTRRHQICFDLPVVSRVISEVANLIRFFGVHSLLANGSDELLNEARQRTDHRWYSLLESDQRKITLLGHELE